jgi:hypothetical protein
MAKMMIGYVCNMKLIGRGPSRSAAVLVEDRSDAAGEAWEGR